MKKRISFIFTALLSVTACGTIVGGSNTNVRIASNVESADVFIDGKHKCRTPCSVRLSNSMFRYDIRLEADGYRPQETELKSTVNVFTTYNLSNLSVGGLTDLSTGGFWTYGKNRILVILEKENATPEEKKQTEILRFAYANYTEMQGEAFRNDNPEAAEGDETPDIADAEQISALHALTGLSKKFIANEALKDMEPDVFAKSILNAYETKNKKK